MAPRRALAGLLAAPVLVLTGCGGDSSVADPPVHSAPHSVATSDPAAHETAEHFIQRWLDVGTDMQNSGNTAAYLAMTRKCRDCEAVARRVETAYARGGFYRTRGVRAIRVRGSDSSDRPEFEVLVNFFPTTYRTSSAAKSQHFAGGPGHFQVRLMPHGVGWLVVSFVQVAS